MFDLAPYLQARREEIERALDDVLPAETEHPHALHRAMRYAVFTGGKRLRPILCLAAAEAAGAARTVAMPAALAIELLHTYTLVHDDLPAMDDDTERRGKPTVHIAFGEANAVLCGDALQAMAFEVVAGTVPTERYPSASLVAALAAAAGSHGVVGGQVADLAAIDSPPDREQLTWIHQHKTADLFQCAVCMGAMAANAPGEMVCRMASYGSALGLAFQITDDLLDAPTDGTLPDDLSCLSLWSRDEAEAFAREHVGAAHHALEGLNDAHSAPLRSVADFVLSRRL